MPLVTDTCQYEVDSFVLDIKRAEFHVAYNKYSPDGTFIGRTVGSITGENFVDMQIKNPELYAMLKQEVYNEVAILEEVQEPWEVT